MIYIPNARLDELFRSIINNKQKIVIAILTGHWRDGDEIFFGENFTRRKLVRRIFLRRNFSLGMMNLPKISTATHYFFSFLAIIQSVFQGRRWIVSKRNLKFSLCRNIWFGIMNLTNISTPLLYFCSFFTLLFRVCFKEEGES